MIRELIQACKCRPCLDGHASAQAVSVIQRPPRNHLVVNMDVNKTIVMTDSVTGKTAENVVNEVLANASWGFERKGVWAIHSVVPATLRPQEQIDGEAMVSYAEWLEEQFPGKDHKKNRMNLSGKFTHAGQPGEPMAARARTMIDALKGPDGTDVRVIPAFFELLASLKKQKRSFCLCFRTFGEDLVDVAEELNAFCEGRHYLFPGVRMDGSDGGPDYRLHISDMDFAEQWGTFHRNLDTGCLSLVLGTLEQPGEGKHRDAKDKSIGFYNGYPCVHRIIEGFEKVQGFVRKRTDQCCTMGLRDYHQYWKLNEMTSTGGKVFFFRRHSDICRHDVFFDDNIRFSDAYIINPVDIKEPDRKSFIIGLLQSHLCRAEPLEAIFDRQYFVKEVERLEAGYDRRRRAHLRWKASMHAVRVSMSLGAIIGAADFIDQVVDPWQDMRKAKCDHRLSLINDEGNAFTNEGMVCCLSASLEEDVDDEFRCKLQT